MRATLDARDVLAGRHDPLVPPRRLGLPSQIHGVGVGIAEHALKGGAGLQPDERILDVGCGVGRIGAHLTGYLEPQRGGSYDGFDVMPDAIAWCRRRITPRHPEFRFQLAELHNGTYSPVADADAAAFEFPYPGDRFDVVFAASLYTHMFAYQVANYLEQTARVLRPGGRSAASFFLLNEDSEERLREGVQVHTLEGGETLDFGADRDDGHGGRFRTTKPNAPEARIALHEGDVREMHAAAGLEIVEVRAGNWAGRPRESHPLGQDWVFSRVAADQPLSPG